MLLKRGSLGNDPARTNDRGFLCDVVETCQRHRLKICVFGGWAEELRGVVPPRPHKDVDLLVHAQGWRVIEQAMQSEPSWHEITAKRFPHKRAVLVAGVMVEFFLVDEDPRGLHTTFFGTYRHGWPPDIFASNRVLACRHVAIASRAVLERYRTHHALVEAAYQGYLLGNSHHVDHARDGDALSRSVGEP